MGVVYRAVQLGLERVVAVKVITPELASDIGFRERFERESHVAASIEHPNVIPVHYAGDSDGELYIIMRYVEGTDLRALIREQSRLDPQRAAEIVAQVAQALDAAHASGLVHRDVKPGNVLVSSTNGRDHGYLTDFGLTKRLASAAGLTRTGEWVGTVDYVAPEQIEGKAVDARADVYALGCVLHQALTGEVPYVRDSDVAKMYAHLNEPPPSVTQLVPDLSPAFDAVVARAMAKDPAARYPSAGDLGLAAQAAAQGLLVEAMGRSVARGGAAPTAANGNGTAQTLAAPSPTLAVAYDVTRPAPAGGRFARSAPPPAPPPPKRRPGAWIALGAMVAAALLAAAALVATGVLKGDETPTKSERTSQTQDQEESPADPEKDDDPDGKELEPSEATVVQDIADVLDLSAVGVQASRDGRFEDAAANRQEVLSEIDALSSEAGELDGELALLREAIEASVAAIDAYIACGGVACAPSESAAATAAKQSFVDAFNPLAEEYLGRSYSATDF
jgi:Protein kinase domain